eukprot:c14432_g1_i1 orf=195-2282(-)
MAHPLYSSKLSWRKRSITPELHLHPQDPAILALVNGLLTASKELSLCQKPQVCQRINAKNICRRASSLSSLFEEVRDSGVWLPPSALSSFRDLRSTFRNIKTLIHNCRHTSNLLLLMEQDDLAAQFHTLTSSVASALSSLPCDLLEISEEIREHITLVQKHASMATPFIDPEEKVLQSEILSVLAAFEAQTSPDAEMLRHIFETLHFNDVEDCERELHLLEREREKLKRDEQYADIPNINSFMSLMRYARCMVYGLGPEQQVGAACRKYELSCASMRKVVLARENETVEGGGLLIPEDFKCPISLELMVDPVTIASGQTYERSSITRWLEDGHTTCPKTGSKLLHNTIIPNCSLRRLITQWCAENDFILENVEKLASIKAGNVVHDLPSTKAAMEATKLTAEFLVGKFSKGSVEVQRQAAYELRLMAKEGMDNRACVAAAGAVPALAALLNSADKLTQENAVTALLNLSINEKNKDLIMQIEGVLDMIVGVLAADSGATTAARENAAAALFSISASKGYRREVGSRSTAIEGLLHLLREGSPRGKRDAALTLANVALSAEHAATLLQKGAVLAAIQALEMEGSESVAEEVAALLAVLARRQEGLLAVSVGIGQVVAQLVELVSEGSSRTKEYTTAMLLAACSFSEADGTASALREKLRRAPSLFPSLRRLLVGGTPRAQRKAASLLQLLQRYPHI